MFNHAMPVMIVVLCLMAIAYRYYSAFLAAKVAALDESRQTPSSPHPSGARCGAPPPCPPLP